MPGQVACDAGYASKGNLEEDKAMGVTDVMFDQKKGLQPADMTSTPGIYEQFCRFRTGMEAGISYLKRCFGLRRCAWRGFDHYRAYVWSAIVTDGIHRLRSVAGRARGGIVSAGELVAAHPVSTVHASYPRVPRAAAPVPAARLHAPHPVRSGPRPRAQGGRPWSSASTRARPASRADNVSDGFPPRPEAGGGDAGREGAADLSTRIP